MHSLIFTNICIVSYFIYVFNLFARFFLTLFFIKKFHTKRKIKENKQPKYILTDEFEIHIVSLKLVEKLFKRVYNKNDIDENYKNLIS